MMMHMKTGIKRAVKSNYFPLWEAVDGKVRMTQTVKKPKPVSNYTELIKKFAHLSEKDLEILYKELLDTSTLMSRWICSWSFPKPAVRMM